MALQSMTTRAMMPCTLAAPKRGGLSARNTCMPARARSMGRALRVRVHASGEDTDVIIVGGGVAGLCCAKRLHKVRRFTRLFRLGLHNMLVDECAWKFRKAL
eukprot:206882-Prorocentrum_minimum.AAC.5